MEYNIMQNVGKKSLCLDCGRMTICKTVWRKYDKGHKETTATICERGCKYD